VKEKERKAAEKEGRQAKKAAAAAQSGSLDAFISRVHYKVCIQFIDRCLAH